MAHPMVATRLAHAWTRRVAAQRAAYKFPGYRSCPRLEHSPFSGASPAIGQGVDLVTPSPRRQGYHTGYGPIGSGLEHSSAALVVC